MTVIYIQYSNNGGEGTSVPWSYNLLYPAVTSPGTIKANLKDDSNVDTGISLTAINGVTNSTASLIWATSGAGGWPEAVFDGAWYFGAGGETHRLGGLTNGDTYTIEVSGHSGNAGRDADFTVGGTTTRYVQSGTSTPAVPVSFSGTVSGTTLDIDMAYVSSFAYINGLKITITPASGPTLTGPASTTEGSATVAAGTDLDTVTTFNLISGTFSIAQTIDSATATTLNYVAESGANDCVPATPVLGVPLEATISAAGVTPYQIQQEADDGTNPAATFNTTLNGEATHEVVQTMIAVANTTPGESIFGTDLIAVEDDMQAYIVKAANGMNITWAADGTFTTDADQTEIIDVAYFAPSTGQWSCLALTISASGVGATIPPASRTSVFHIAAALRALETFTHTQTNELVVEWLESEGISRTTLNGMLYGYLGGLGYTGSIEDRMKKWRNDA